MTPFELNLRLPFSEDAWYAATAPEWAQLLSTTTEEPVSFLPMLKKSWNPLSTKILTETLPRGANIIMYGLISIARELSHREHNSLSNRSSNSLVWLGHKIRRSFEMWEASWKKVPASLGLKTFAWRNCLCVVRLAHTLYEISPVDLQTVAGKEVIEGKRRGAADYAQSKRKLRLWVKHDRASLGVFRKYESSPVQASTLLFLRCSDSNTRATQRRVTEDTLPSLLVVFVPRLSNLLELRICTNENDDVLERIG